MDQTDSDLAEAAQTIFLICGELWNEDGAINRRRLSVSLTLQPIWIQFIVEHFVKLCITTASN